MSNPNYPEGVTEKDIDNIGEPICPGADDNLEITPEVGEELAGKLSLACKKIKELQKIIDDIGEIIILKSGGC